MPYKLDGEIVTYVTPINLIEVKNTENMRTSSKTCPIFLNEMVSPIEG